MTNKKLQKKLKALHIHRVALDYNGYGDEGSTEDICFYGQSGESIAIDDEDLATLLDEYLCDLLSTHWPEWELNEGSCGKATIEMDAGRIEVHHEQRYVETDLDIYEGELKWRILIIMLFRASGSGAESARTICLSIHGSMRAKPSSPISDTVHFAIMPRAFSSANAYSVARLRLVMAESCLSDGSANSTLKKTFAEFLRPMTG